MSLYENVNHIKLLQQLLQPPNEQLSDSDVEDEHLPATGVHKFGPGNIGAPVKNTDLSATVEPGSTSAYVNAYAKTEEDPSINSIDEWQERQEREDFDALDGRKQPHYQISYKQNVTTEDVFLQMGNKTGATASCDQMIVTIEMPDETVPIDRMHLSVSSTEIDLQSPVYRLRLPLPQRIDPDAGCAQYDAEVKRMTLRLKMIREFDFVNF